MASIKIIEFQQGHKIPLSGGKFLVDGPGPLGAVSVLIRFRNVNSDRKVIKYIRFYVTPYNAVGDVVSCSYGEHSTIALKGTGPIKPYSFWTGPADTNYIFETVWANYTISKAIISKVEIDYMDGSSEVISGDELNKSETH